MATNTWLDLQRLTEQRDELVAALKEARAFCEACQTSDARDWAAETIEKIDAALAKVTA